mgnify:CR=1 FL=1
MKDLNMSKEYYNPREIKNKISSAKNENDGCRKIL